MHNVFTIKSGDQNVVLGKDEIGYLWGVRLKDETKTNTHHTIRIVTVTHGT